MWFVKIWYEGQDNATNQNSSKMRKADAIKTYERCVRSGACDQVVLVNPNGRIERQWQKSGVGR